MIIFLLKKHGSLNELTSATSTKPCLLRGLKYPHAPSKYRTNIKLTIAERRPIGGKVPANWRVYSLKRWVNIAIKWKVEQSGADYW